MSALHDEIVAIKDDLKRMTSDMEHLQNETSITITGFNQQMTRFMRDQSHLIKRQRDLADRIEFAAKMAEDSEEHSSACEEAQS